jgi:hypothetical protein
MGPPSKREHDWRPPGRQEQMKNNVARAMIAQTTYRADAVAG